MGIGQEDGSHACTIGMHRGQVNNRPGGCFIDFSGLPAV
jgi:hypothetical protein